MGILDKVRSNAQSRAVNNVLGDMRSASDSLWPWGLKTQAERERAFSDGGRDWRRMSEACQNGRRAGVLDPESAALAEMADAAGWVAVSAHIANSGRDVDPSFIRKLTGEFNTLSPSEQHRLMRSDRWRTDLLALGVVNAE